MTTTVFSVPGMTCGHCKQAVTTEIGKIAGVSSIDIDLDTKKVTVTSSDPLEWSEVVSAIDEAGFEAVAN